jgi:hypothetical protein
MRPRSLLYGTLAAAMAAGALTAVTAAPALSAPAPRLLPASKGVISPVSPLLYGQTFSGQTVRPGRWIAGGGMHSVAPCLTARYSGAPTSIRTCGSHGGDAPGTGVLRLTTNARQQSGFVLDTKPLNATGGLNISFDMYQFHTTTKRGGADGIGFVLIDGAQSPVTAGDPGGWLGYRGLVGAYLGVGFDEWGNFSNRALWGSGPNRLVPDSIVVRGAAAAGYPYLRGVRTAQLAADNVRYRGGARRHVVIKISTSGVMTVSVNFGHGLIREIRSLDLDNVPGQPALPPTVKFGFTAATGDDTAVHEISHLVINALRPDLDTVIKPASKFRAGGTGDLTATVASDPSGGPTAGPVTALVTVPGALTPTGAQGDGWNCTVAAQQASCTRPDLLRPGTRYPPIDVSTSIAPNAPRKLTVRSAADTPDMYLSRANVSRATVPILPPPPPPDLAVKMTPVGPLVAGGVGKLRLDVSNAPQAGPTNGLVTLTYNAPPSSTVTSAQGAGWTCAVQPVKVTCTRPDVLKRGTSYPPVYVTMAICHRADCALKNATAAVRTPGTGVAIDKRNLPVTQHSALGLSLSSNPATPVPGYDTTFTAVITNGGPTDVENAEVLVRVPHGFDGAWTCLATAGSGCPGTLPAGQLNVKVYLASGGTVTLTATGDAAGAEGSMQVAATLAPPGSYTDLYCSRTAPCTAVGDAVAGNVAK